MTDLETQEWLLAKPHGELAEMVEKWQLWFWCLFSVWLAETILFALCVWALCR